MNNRKHAEFLCEKESQEKIERIKDKQRINKTQSSKRNKTIKKIDLRKEESK